MEGQGQGRVTQSDLHSVDTVDYVVSSQMKQDTFAFAWTLADYNSFLVDKEVLSPLLYGGPNTNHTWQLIVDPKGTHNYGSSRFTSLSVCLRLNRFGRGFRGGFGSPVNASFQTSILDKDNNIIFQTGSPVEFHPFVLMTPSKRQDLVVCRHDRDYEDDKFEREFDARMDRVLVNGALKLHCRIWIKYKVEHVSSSLGINFEDVQDANSRRPENLARGTQWGTEATRSTYAILRHCAETTFGSTTLHRQH